MTDIGISAFEFQIGFKPRKKPEFLHETGIVFGFVTYFSVIVDFYSLVEYKIQQ